MTKYTPNFKHKILMEYRRGDRGASFSVLARRHKIKGGKKAIQYWYSQWKGTPNSLERRKGSGRKFILTPSQVDQYINKPILKKNKKHQAVSYPELMDTLHENSPSNISLRTVQRYGKQWVGIQCKTTIPRTLDECKN